MSHDIDSRIREVLAHIIPAIQADGGNLEYLGFDEGFVKVRLMGACTSCSSSSTTLYDGVERLLMEQIPEVEGIIPMENLG